VLDFLDGAASLPLAERVAAVDNDGTLWCERPRYIQYEFFVDALRRRTRAAPSLAARPELAAVLDGDQAAMQSFGLPRLAMALAGLFEGLTPDEYTSEVVRFMERAHHHRFARPLAATVYQPMLELLGELRRLEFTVAIVSGGGTEFVRSISEQLYGVAPERVVGTLIAYDIVRDQSGRPAARRTARLVGEANEGAAKVANIQAQLGRRPVLAAGNSAGDREMLEWAVAGDGPRLALLVDHDDPDREYAYESVAATVSEAEPVTEVGRRLGWTIVSMADDWATVFPPHAGAGDAQPS
jgi:phosphoserine phosphatase